MSSQYIYECQIWQPTLERIEKTAPEEFLPAYEWFIENEGQRISTLPHRMETPLRIGGIPISRDSGIYSPSASRVRYPNLRYALSVHSSGNGLYSDRPPISLEDGTWIIDYSAHQAKGTSPKGQDYNDWLMNCLDSGLPVGTMMKEQGVYRILGLAFVERYNSASKMFTLHGPVNDDTIARGLFNLPEFEGLSADEKIEFEELDFPDERQRVLVEQVRRIHQDSFRALMMQAYGGNCAVTHTGVPETLQAAHINPYRGSKSQVVNNGILLRADIHLLYDAHLISVNPEDYRLRMAKQLGGSPYAKYNGMKIAETLHASETPSPKLLKAHFDQFQNENLVMC